MASSPPSDRSRSRTPATPSSKAAVNASLAAIVRPSCHIALDGSAESTSMPASRLIVSPGRPTASHTAPSAPEPTDASDDTRMAFSKTRWR